MLKHWAALIETGTAARIVLGTLLGAGIGYATDRKRNPAPGTPLLMGEGRQFYAWIGLALVLLGLIAPHADRWLAAATGFKTAIIEIQLANISTKHKFIAPEFDRTFTEQAILPIVARYPERILQDIEFKKFQIEEQEVNTLFGLTMPWQISSDEEKKNLEEHKKVRDSMTAIHLVFEKTISPAAKCMEEAIGRGLSRQYAREIARPVAELTAEIIGFSELLEKREHEEAQASADQKQDANSRKKKIEEHLIETRENLQKELERIALPGRLPRSWSAHGCKWPDFTAKSSDLDHAKYRGLPYLHTAMAAILSLADYERLAFTFLEREIQKKQFKFMDYQLPYFHYRLLLARNEPVTEYLHHLDKIREVAHERLDVLDRVEKRCAGKCDNKKSRSIEEIRAHAKHADAYAMVLILVGVAQDLAAGTEGAGSLAPLAIEYAKSLDKLVQDPASTSNGTFDATEREAARDAVAFITIVVEARKPSPDQKIIKDAVASLEQVISTQGVRLGNQLRSGTVDERDRVLRDRARAHLSSARPLAGE